MKKILTLLLILFSCSMAFALNHGQVIQMNLRSFQVSDDSEAKNNERVERTIIECPRVRFSAP